MNELIRKYLEAKQAEDLAKNTRIALGNEIAASLDGPDEGSKTHRVDDYKVTVKRVVNRKCNWDEFDAVTARHIGKPVPAKTKRELDDTGLRWLRENEPDYYLELCAAITATPGRPQIEVKEISK